MKFTTLTMAMLATLTLATPAFAVTPNEAFLFEVNIDMIKLSKNREQKVSQAAEIIKEVVASDLFKEAVLNHEYLGKKQYADNNGLSNSEIYLKILDGAERLNPVANNAMDLELELYTDMKSNTVGFTRSNHKRIWVNTKFFNIFPARSVASNLMHEWLHKLGFSHAVKASKRRKNSVPYAVGKMIRKISRKLRK